MGFGHASLSDGRYYSNGLGVVAVPVRQSGTREIGLRVGDNGKVASGQQNDLRLEHQGVDLGPC
jgi:hypothetical protein